MRPRAERRPNNRPACRPSTPALESLGNREHRAEGPAALARRFGLSWVLGLVAVSFEGKVTAICPTGEYRLLLDG
ncbi:hypothetical protein NDU88_002718 [Pleurodeles waltl]|uniref:Uncharacterized protein n=1 Tax=Pleurodeles waltl TaxID=8319 RepID=A0AAV7W368_PLEWA|nr:hypothetical protein NDU88_002718 [Pleurodeles waltl]